MQTSSIVKKISFILAICLLIKANTIAQKICEVQCRIPIQKGEQIKSADKNEYINATGLLVYDDDFAKSGFLRLTWFDKVQQKNVLVDLEINESYWITELQMAFASFELMKTLKGKPAQFPQSLPMWFSYHKQKDNKISPFTGKFKDSTYYWLTEKIYEKHYVVSRPNEAQDYVPGSYVKQLDSFNTMLSGPDYSICTSVKNLNIKNLSRKYLASFFLDYELPFKSSFVWKDFYAARKKLLPRIYCITMSSTLDPKIGASCRFDETRTAAFFQSISEFAGFPYTNINLNGKNFTLTALKNTIKNLHPLPNDVIVFAYSGHGFSYDKDTNNLYPQLMIYEGKIETAKQVKSNTINMEMVLKLLQAKKARFNVLLGDCCNSYIGLQRVIDNIPIGMMGYPTTWRKNTCMRLFSDIKGSFISSATRKGEVAGGNIDLGGYFSYSFFEVLHNKLQKEVNANPLTAWHQLWQEANEKTSSTASNYGYIQHMQYKYVK